MDELKQKILNIAIEFKRICEKHNLRYYLAFGTFLGAVRHKGFIPWDDDIDFQMPRSDYEKFLNIAKIELNSNFALRTLEEDGYIYEFAKIDDVNTTLVETFNKSSGYKGGVYIDIFPIDGVPDDKKTMKNFISKAKRERTLASLGLVDFSSKKYPLYKRIVINLGKNLNGKKHLYNLDNLLKEESLYNTKKVFSSVVEIDVLWDRKLFDEVDEYFFEGVQFKGVKNYDKYLTICYGDYMKLPPKEQQISNHFYEGLDLHKSYKQ